MKKGLMMLKAGGKFGPAISPSAFVLKGKHGHFPKLNKLTLAANAERQNFSFSICNAGINVLLTKNTNIQVLRETITCAQ